MNNFTCLSTHHLSFIKISSSLSSKFENLRIIVRGYSVERGGDVCVLCTCYKGKENRLIKIIDYKK